MTNTYWLWSLILRDHLTLDPGPDFRLGAGNRRCPVVTVRIWQLAKQQAEPS
jgi:hypothetical protein